MDSLKGKRHVNSKIWCIDFSVDDKGRTAVDHQWEAGKHTAVVALALKEAGAHAKDSL